MSGNLKAGVVGVGHLGRHHARVFADMEGVDLVGVVDRDEERASEIAKRHGARVFQCAEELAREIEIASVAVNTVEHEKVATALLEQDVATLVEKPIATSVEEGRRLVDLAAERGVPLAVGHIERCQPAVGELANKVKDPRFLEIHRLAPFKPRSLDVDVILDLMIHDLDICRFLLRGAKVVSFDASGTEALTDKIDIASVRIRFETGAAANLTASRISVEPVRRIRVFERGSFTSCDTAQGTLAVFSVDRSSGTLPKIDKNIVPVPAEEPLVRELGSFVSAVRQGDQPFCTGEDGLAALELALAIRDSIEAQNAGK